MVSILAFFTSWEKVFEYDTQPPNNYSHSLDHTHTTRTARAIPILRVLYGVSSDLKIHANKNSVAVRRDRKAGIRVKEKRYG